MKMMLKIGLIGCGTILGVITIGVVVSLCVALFWESKWGDMDAARKKTDSILGQGQKAGETKTILLPGGAEMEMVWCPPGTFMMGSPESEEGRDEDETLHQVILTKGFWMAKTEVTQAQWKSVMGKNPSAHKGDDNLPVESVSGLALVKFCMKTGLQLPYEAEWEYACRAGSTGPFAAGGWCKADSGGQTHPVGQKGANAWGLQDMHGNVWEWCSDSYKSYSVGAVTNPISWGGKHKVMRGGGCKDDALFCRSAERDVGYIADGYFPVGFRPVARPD